MASHWSWIKRKSLNYQKTQHQGTQRKPQRMTWKYFNVKTWKLYFDNLSIRVSQSKTMQAETNYKLIKLISYISLTFSDWLLTLGTNSRRFVQYVVGVFNKTIVPLVLVGYEMISSFYFKTFVQPRRCRASERIHKWLPRNYSFVFVLIILTSLTLKQKFFWILFVLMRLVSMISIN